MYRPRSSETRAKARANNVDFIRSGTTTLDAAAAADGGDNRDVLRYETRDDSMINSDSAGQQRQKPTTKRRLASFR